eukprot:TRINITY_DN411_c0_g2_i1.p2 TRINITY_DN411_c0_g2~~TRINITY_DN411_c0_g2_i1.p2  ORF type:complete len:327 (-),score=57.55 TRINITY_DN411_c0_g2_i1:2786-3766(-)
MVFILPSYWFPEETAKILTSEIMMTQNIDKNYHEEVSEAVAARDGIKIKDLSRVFKSADGGDFYAVDKLNLNMYEGQIFVLLGHNGAGKTTTINMLTGMLKTSSGLVEFYGRELNNITPSEKSMDLCPQHNEVLFPTLTVAQHLSLRGSLKNIPGAKLNDAVDDAISNCNLQKQKNQKSDSLSGGQKRRLLLEMALIGGSKVVFLDEPTSGVDVDSARATWNSLRNKKNNRVIVLTTHSMDEADALGDRIGIMHHGKLKCCGSSLFLKSKYGVGYSMVLNKTPECVPKEVDQLFTNHIPGTKNKLMSGLSYHMDCHLNKVPNFLHY